METFLHIEHIKQNMYQIKKGLPKFPPEGLAHFLKLLSMNCYPILVNKVFNNVLSVATTEAFA